MQNRKIKLKELRHNEKIERLNLKELEKETPGVKFYEKLPEWVRKKYYHVINGECQLCHKKMLYKDMEVHRKIRSTHGGKYTLCKLNHPNQNCMFVHSECHRKLHENEKGNGSENYT